MRFTVKNQENIQDYLIFSFKAHFCKLDLLYFGLRSSIVGENLLLRACPSFDLSVFISWPSPSLGVIPTLTCSPKLLSKEPS